MDKNVYVLDKEVTSVDTDFNLDVKLSSLFLYFQEASSLASEELHIGKKETIDKDLHWVISRFNVDINRLPKYGDKLKVITYPGDNNKVFFYRHFMIKDINDNVLVRANSVWLIVDGKTRQVKRDPFMGRELPSIHMEDELEVPSKINETASIPLYTKTIRYSDIDLNTHLNNTRYIELIQDAFDINFYKDNQIKRITINYNAELKLNDEVTMYSNGVNPYIISGRKDDKDHFVSKLEFVKR